MKLDYLRLTSAIRLKGGNETSHVQAREYEVAFEPTGNGMTVAWGAETVFVPWHMVREVHYVSNRDVTGGVTGYTPVTGTVTLPVTGISPREHGGGFQLGPVEEPAEESPGQDSESNPPMEKPLFKKRGRPPKAR